MQEAVCKTVDKKCLVAFKKESYFTVEGCRYKQRGHHNILPRTAKLAGVTTDWRQWGEANIPNWEGCADRDGTLRLFPEGRLYCPALKTYDNIRSKTIGVVRVTILNWRYCCTCISQEHWQCHKFVPIKLI